MSELDIPADPEYRDPAPSNQFRPRNGAHLVVGLSGNLGFTHDPATVFAAARILRNEAGIHFLLSGWGVGWKQLGDLQSAEQLPNVTLLDPCTSRASGRVSVAPPTSGRITIAATWRACRFPAVSTICWRSGAPSSSARGSLRKLQSRLREEKIGWVGAAEDPVRLAQAIRAAAADLSEVARMGRSAAVAAEKFTEEGGA